MMLNPDQKSVLNIDLSDPGAIPEPAIKDAVALMRTGRLHRYAECAGSDSAVSMFEQEYAAYVGSRYAVGINSGGCAIFIALKIAGVEAGDKVLVNAFNRVPVPGAIEHVGGDAALVEVDADYRINLADLEHQAASGAKVLLLTHIARSYC